MDMAEAVRRCNELARRWGGSVVATENFSVEGLCPCPFDDMAVDLSVGSVLVGGSAEKPGNIIHEMGHVFAVASVAGDEFRFFGWEYATARVLRMVGAWKASSRDYRVDGKSGATWADLTGAGRRKLLAERLRFARRMKLIDANGMPLCRWKP